MIVRAVECSCYQRLDVTSLEGWRRQSGEGYATIFRYSARMSVENSRIQELKGTI